MRKRAASIPPRVTYIRKQAALEAGGTVADRTPVDEGTAISNWILTTGTPATNTRDPFQKGARGSTRRANITAVKAEMKAKLALSIPSNVDIIISNNLDYIQKLNTGSSKQAPANFVQAAVVRGVNKIKNIRVLTY